MNYFKTLKRQKISLILALIFMMALFAGPYTALAANLETRITEPVLSPAPSLYNTYSITGPVVAPSSEKATIINIQQKLVGLGYDTGGIDGIYGPKTRNAVMLFQASRNLAVDGIAGPKTLAALGL
ncbi:Putative peptidoglycan binding domain-containing protein [Desulfotomaculum arcticum]|uniref:Putative peptidoglycan binding domain-containing protein n=1 Tax=Desulfotruncus arcticus DSM 17038 TaxID=1121424 RepID=A0A1I2VIA8_9FIRM|nr:peptidoglycan-binding domain-containing protein [Desulfotruncus arcticus]SFG89044.1 Putative peptidoglycan binding domain-containing protein [Desulfotomaculum arcticum] [Desulfotruncus arcticus DSM 17038]